MKPAGFLMLCVILSWFSMSPGHALAQSKCPEGQDYDSKRGNCVKCPDGMWFHPNARKCIWPGEDSTGEVDRVLK